LEDGASDKGTTDALEEQKRILRIVIFALASFSAILVVVIIILLCRGRKAVKYAPVSVKADYPDGYERQDFVDPYLPGSRYTSQR